MPWPQLTDYQEAIQSPRRCFSDAELRQGTPVLDALGLPRPVTGGFASVYQIVSGGRRFAVRCFNRPAPDAERRYHLIDQHLRAARLPYTVQFEYLTRGILVRGEWYPILKMEWLAGEPLHLYLEQHLDQPWAIRLLAHQFARMCDDLARANIAHGDLQHGNILVVDGALRLIDYDGMYVPALAGLPSLELGHRNYQHPARADDDFGPNLDHFAAWVIYTSLVALGHQPGLWRHLQAGDECLLFRRDDFEHPNASPALTALAGQADPTAAALAAALRRLLTATDLDAVPPLDRRLATPAARSGTATPVPEWAQPEYAMAAAPVVPAPAPGGGGQWLRDQVDTVQAVPLTAAHGLERVLLLAALVTILITLVSAGVGRMLPAMAAVLIASAALTTVSVLGWRYSSRGEVARKRALLAGQRRLSRQLDQTERSLGRVAAALDRLTRDEAREVGRLTPRLAEVTQRQTAELARVAQRLKQATDRLDGERQRLLATEASEQARALRRWHDQLVQRHLARQWVMTAAIAGVGLNIKTRLLGVGVRTAADLVQVRAQIGGDSVGIVVAGVGPVRVSGIGPARAAALADWRRSVEATFRATLSPTLPPAQEAALQARFADRRAALAKQTSAATADAQARGDRVRLTYGRQREQLDQRVRGVHDRFGGERTRLTREQADQRARLAEQQRHLDQVRADLLSYQAVTVGAYVRRLVSLPGSP